MKNISLVILLSLCSVFSSKSIYASNLDILAECHNCSNYIGAALQAHGSTNLTESIVLVYDYEKESLKKYIIIEDPEMGRTTATEIQSSATEQQYFNEAVSSWADLKNFVRFNEYHTQTGLTVYDLGKDQSFINRVKNDFNANALLARKINNSINYLLSNLTTAVLSVKGANFVFQIRMANGGKLVLKVIALSGNGDALYEIVSAEDSEGNDVPLAKSDITKMSPYVYSSAKNVNYKSLGDLAKWHNIPFTSGGGDTGGGSGTIIDCGEEGCKARRTD